LAISSYLRDCGFRVIEAASSAEALSVLQRPEHLPVELVFADVQLPGEMNGFLLSQWIRAKMPEVKVLLVASPAHATDAAAELCEEGPLLSKPYEPEDVLDHIRRLLASRYSSVKE
jgi:CheY-like chemotaxis protein